MLSQMMGAGTHAWMTGYLGGYTLDMGKWYRSKDKVAGRYPYGGYLTNKKWHLNEVTYFKQFIPIYPKVEEPRCILLSGHPGCGILIYWWLSHS